MLIVASHMFLFLDFVVFLIDVNDIFDVSKELEFISFADDANVFLSYKKN